HGPDPLVEDHLGDAEPARVGPQVVGDLPAGGVVADHDVQRAAARVLGQRVGAHPAVAGELGPAVADVAMHLDRVGDQALLHRRAARARLGRAGRAGAAAGGLLVAAVLAAAVVATAVATTGAVVVAAATAAGALLGLLLRVRDDLDIQASRTGTLRLLLPRLGLLVLLGLLVGAVLGLRVRSGPAAGAVGPVVAPGDVLALGVRGAQLQQRLVGRRRGDALLTG